MPCAAVKPQLFVIVCADRLTATGLLLRLLRGGASPAVCKVRPVAAARERVHVPAHTLAVPLVGVDTVLAVVVPATICAPLSVLGLSSEVAGTAAGVAHAIVDVSVTTATLAAAALFVALVTVVAAAKSATGGSSLVLASQATELSDVQSSCTG